MLYSLFAQGITPDKVKSNQENAKQEMEVQEVDINELLAFEWWERLKAKKHHELPALQKVARKIDSTYVDPERIKPQEMFTGALNSLEQNIPEVLVKEQDKKIRLEIKGKVKYFDEKFSELRDTLDELKSAYKFVKDNLLDPIEEDDLEFYMTQGFVGALDPHTLMLSKDTFREMKLTTTGEFEGLGIVITLKKGVLTVVSPIEGGPAYKGGVKADDKIVRINDESTVNMSLTEAVTKMRGKKGTKVTIYILREGLTEPFPVKITRDVIIVKSVSSKLLPGGIGYIRLSQFQGHTSENLKKHIVRLKKKSPLFNGLILDLRNNPGGLLDESVKVSDLFLDKGVIVTAVGMKNKLYEEHKANKATALADVPLIILVNRGSASASEIVAGAIKNNNRGIIVGSQTFGKGTVQTIVDLRNGTALKMTIAKYLTTGMVSIQNIGITPDIALVPVILGEKEIVLYKDAHMMGEMDLENNFGLKNKEKKDESKYVIKYLKKEKKDKDKISKRMIVKDKEEADVEKEDYEVKFAADLLRKIHVHDRNKFLEEFEMLKGNIKEVNEKETSKALLEKGISWAAGKNPKKPKVSLNLEMKEGYLKAGEEVELILSLTNKGKKPLFRMWALSNTDRGIFNKREFIFGKVDVGATVSRSIKLKMPQNMISTIEDVKFNLYDENQKELYTVSREIAIKGELPPQFVYSYQVIDNCAACDGDGIADKGEEVLINGFIKNIGEGDAKDVLGVLKNLNGKGIFLKKGREKIGKIIKGQVKEFSFNFRVSPDYEKDKFEMEYTIYDVELDRGISNKIGFNIGTISKSNFKTGQYYFEVDRQAPVYTDISKNPKVLYSLGKGVTVFCDRMYDNFYRMKIGRDNFAFLKRDSFIPIAKSKTNYAFTKKDLVLFYQMIPPDIKITNIDDLAKVKRDELEFMLDIKDEKQVKDVIIYVNNEKIYYELNKKKGKQFKVSTKLPIAEGNNRIIVVSRDNDNLSSSKILTIRKLPGNKILTIR